MLSRLSPPLTLLHPLLIRPLSSLGHSPMSQPAPFKKAKEAPYVPLTNRLGTADDGSGGGIWANTSAKKDKILELRGELPFLHRPVEGDEDFGKVEWGRVLTLSDMCSEKEVVEVEIAEGLGVVFRACEGAEEDTTMKIVADKIVNAVESSATLETEVQFKQHLKRAGENIAKEIEVVEERLATGYGSSFYLRKVADFVDVEGSGVVVEEVKDNNQAPDKVDKEGFGMYAKVTQQEEPEMQFFSDMCLLTRLSMAQHTLALLDDKFPALTTEADADVDRRALASLPMPTIALSRSALDLVLVTTIAGSPQQRLQAWWALRDGDGDGLLEETEMADVVNWYAQPISDTASSLLSLTIDSLEEDKKLKIGTKAHKKELNKLLKKTMKHHYEIETEAPHRIRCVYAWADKEHQDGELKAVHVSEDVTGRKRFVELMPKLSYSEFRGVQDFQFGVLDGFGADVLRSFKDDLLVKQGTGRQNRELLLQSFGFFAVVSGLDYVTYLI